MADSYDTMMGVALRRAGRHGSGHSQRKTKRIEIDGTYRPLWTFVGPIHRVDGIITCYYHGSRIFAVDFINARVTNFDMTSYSLSTGANISGWAYACWRMFTFPSYVQSYGAWMSTPRTYSYRRPTDQSAYDRFCARAPWVYDDRQGTRWFAWEHFDMMLARVFHESCSSLADDQNWRYFEYDWDDFGKWARHFLSDDAERRWNARERRRELKARKRAA